ncbi:MAG: DUF2079 domain-containing protein [Nostoc sp.]|uniref:DUF2079 domain-containing protein n=1 Tax=Nostoc sp. TaxID=1180 RepID=UPI002FF75BBA
MQNFTLCANSLAFSNPCPTIDFTLCANSVAWNSCNSVVQISSYLRTDISLVKTPGSVLTTSRIAPHLSQRQIINLINTNAKPDYLIRENIEYLLLDVRTKNRENQLDFNPELSNQLKNNQAFKLIYQQDDVYLFQKQ